MAIVIKSIITASTGGNSVTTSPNYNASADGVDGIVVVVQYFTHAGLAVTDSQGNTYTELTPKETSGVYGTSIWYKQAPSVSTAMNWTVSATQFAGIVTVYALNGTSSSGFYSGTQTGSTSVGTTTIKPGSITPATGDFLATGNCNVFGGAVNYSLDNGYTVDFHVNGGGASVGGASGSLVSTDGSAKDVQWTLNQTTNQAAVHALFKAAGGGGGPTFIPRRMMSGIGF